MNSFGVRAGAKQGSCETGPPTVPSPVDWWKISMDAGNPSSIQGERHKQSKYFDNSESTTTCCITTKKHHPSHNHTKIKMKFSTLFSGFLTVSTLCVSVRRLSSKWCAARNLFPSLSFCFHYFFFPFNQRTYRHPFFLLIYWLLGVVLL